MAAKLKVTKELRMGITDDIDAALTAVARAWGGDKQEVARSVLAEWAEKKLHEATVLVGLSIANGTVPASAGLPAAEGGISRSGARK